MDTIKIKFTLEYDELKLAMNFLLHLNEAKIQAIIDSYRDYEFNGIDTLDTLKAIDILNGAKEVLGFLLSEKQIVFTTVEPILSFTYWLGVQAIDDTVFILGKDREDEEARKIDQALFSLYSNLDDTLRAL